MAQNLYSDFEDAPTAAVKHLKTQLFVKLKNALTAHRADNATACEFTGWSDEKMRQFRKGDLHEITVDDLVEALARLGFDVEPVFVAHGNAQ